MLESMALMFVAVFAALEGSWLLHIRPLSAIMLFLIAAAFGAAGVWAYIHKDKEEDPARSARLAPARAIVMALVYISGAAIVATFAYEEFRYNRDMAILHLAGAALFVLRGVQIYIDRNKMRR